MSRILPFASEEIGYSENLEARLSITLSSIFRGRLCRTLLQNRSAQTFQKGETIYEMGQPDGAFYFIRSGVVKVGSITHTGEEIVFDIRKAGEVVGELGASSSPRIDRAVALEVTDVIPISCDEVLETIQKNRPLLSDLIQLFCDSLSSAYEQVTSLAFRDTMERLTKTLLDLADQLGRPAGNRTEITTYLTHEEIAQMVAARRERVSLGLSHLRRHGMVEYTTGGHLIIDSGALRDYQART